MKKTYKIKLTGTEWGMPIGVCEGRKVKWTFSVSMWFFTDGSDYLCGRYEVS